MRFLRNTRLIITKLLFYDALPAPYAEMLLEWHKMQLVAEREPNKSAAHVTSAWRTLAGVANRSARELQRAHGRASLRPTDSAWLKAAVSGLVGVPRRTIDLQHVLMGMWALVLGVPPPVECDRCEGPSRSAMAGCAVATRTTAACFEQDPNFSTGERRTRPKLLDIQRPDFSPIMTHGTAPHCQASMAALLWMAMSSATSVRWMVANTE
ncbi:hypothetical protein [Cupriavidus sp. amp6]|uniref:hypothetical protein n=1 Tax=Cupriavidus sp. amp6 TaxID=388051 RepID=UPI0018DE1F22|nr:hypothetical protein [Cupriavidus sp. amp6]